MQARAQTACTRKPAAGAAAGRHIAMAAQAAAAAPSVAIEKATLMDMPVSNHGARVRHVIYVKGLEQQYDIQPPSLLGGLKSADYLALNPQGKMPLLVLPGGKASLPESEVIVGYLLDLHAGQGPSLVAATPEGRARAALLTRIHDIYIAPIQGAMYKAMDAAQRAQQLGQLAAQLDALEETVAAGGGPWAAGPDMTSADSALFPTFVFMLHILPRHFGWADVFKGRIALAGWWRAVQAEPSAARVIAEVQDGLDGWEAKGRWQELGISDQVAAGGHQFAY